jgi:hypothetical protein
MDAGLLIGAVGIVIGVIGLVLAARERRKRRELDAELRRPEVVVKLAARGRESEGLKRIQASRAVTNMGATVATEVRFGLRCTKRTCRPITSPSWGSTRPDS